MSKAEDKYLTCTHHKCSCEVDYIIELEQQNKELIQFACDNCIGICYYDECKIYKYKESE